MHASKFLPDFEIRDLRTRLRQIQAETELLATQQRSLRRQLRDAESIREARRTSADMRNDPGADASRVQRTSILDPKKVRIPATASRRVDSTLVSQERPMNATSDPSPLDIWRRCVAIQATWTRAQELKRRVTKVPDWQPPGYRSIFVVRPTRRGLRRRPETGNYQGASP
ncbi:MAG: hypothetical protein JSS02_32105 [Planctomycetes bacterium]|nr:hypothetical protein [Planctomycetota bacterium]